jgi:hypothetical protein
MMLRLANARNARAVPRIRNGPDRGRPWSCQASAISRLGFFPALSPIAVESFTDTTPRKLPQMWDASDETQTHSTGVESTPPERSEASGLWLAQVCSRSLSCRGAAAVTGLDGLSGANVGRRRAWARLPTSQRRSAQRPKAD